MEISFKTKKLKTLCEQTKQAQKALGHRGAQKLRARMAELKAASSVTELCAGRPHPLTGDRKEQFALDLIHPQRLVFVSANDPIPRKNNESNQDKHGEDEDLKDQNSEDKGPEDARIDWSRVTRVRIIEIGDYHG